LDPIWGSKFWPFQENKKFMTVRSMKARLRQSDTPVQRRSEGWAAVLLCMRKPFPLTHCSCVNASLKRKKTKLSEFHTIVFNLIHFHVIGLKCANFYDT